VKEEGIKVVGINKNPNKLTLRQRNYTGYPGQPNVITNYKDAEN
jgi:hypothetical protein